MDRNFLEELGLEKEVIDSIMKKHGKAIQAVKPAEDIEKSLEDLKNEKVALEKQVEELNGTLTSTTEKYADVDQTLVEKEKIITDYETKNLKYRIANQAGLPLDLAERLAGETEGEIKADAEKLSGFVSKPPVLPLKPTEPDIVDVEDQAYSSMLENLKGE